MQYKIIVDKQPRTNPSSEKKEYIIDIEELRRLGDVYDTLTIELDKTYVTRRLQLSEYGVLSVLSESIIENLDEVDIELFEGDNYIYLYDMQGNHFYAEYLVKNEFTDLYVTVNQMNSSITQSAQSIEFNVSQTLQEYSTTEEMNSVIQQTASEINLEVSKKVGDDEVISKINQSAEKIQINANKISLEGKTINLTSDDIVIASNNFNVTKNGNITANSANLNNVNINGGLINITDQEGGQNFQIKRYDGSYILYMWSNGITVNGQYATIAVRGEMAGFGTSDSSGNVHSSMSNSGIVTPTVTQTSLEENKKNIEKLEEKAIDIIKNIDIYKYNLKFEEDTNKKHLGFVIGDNYNYSKEVTNNDNTGVDDYSFISLCCKAIQEQQEQIEQLQKRLKKLEEKEENNG